MSQENHITSPPGSGTSKRSREASQSVAFASSIQGSANPSLQSTPVTPLSYPSSRVSEIDNIRAKIESKETEIKNKEEIFNKITMELEAATENISDDLRQVKLIRIGSLAKSIEQLRDEINHFHKEKIILQDAKESERAGASTFRSDKPKFPETFITDGNIPRLNIPGLHGFITLPKRFLAGSGIGRKDDDTHLFIRQSFLGQMDFIRNKVITGEKCGYIYGMPGTGKSVGTYLFASSLAVDWTVIWVHFQFFANKIDNPCLCVRMSGCSKYVAEVPFVTMHEFLLTRQNFFDKREILILDSLTNRTEFDKFIPSSADWWREDRTNRRLILVSSMAAFGKYKEEELENAGIELYQQFSWTLDEYKSAIKNSGFFNSVEKFLDADPRRNQKRNKIVEAKFFYSGGCARSTFQKTTEQVKILIKKSIDSVSDISSLLSGNTGNTSSVTSQNLLDVHFDNGQRLVSAYAALQIAQIKGPDFIKNLAIHPLLLGNPFINGGFFELFFFCHARQGRIVLHHKNGQEVEWICKAEVSVFIPKSPTLLTCAQGQWLKPNIWNQGGYDGVYLHRKMRRNVITFMQITRKNKHDVKLRYFLELIHALECKKVFTAKDVEIYFIVPKKHLASYKIGRIESPNALYTLGWPDSEDGVRDRIQILGLDF